MPDDPASEFDGRVPGRLQAGDADAEAEVFEHYVARLTALARRRLSAKLAARIDAEDVVMSAYRSFFLGARNGRFELAAGGDLWRLLVEITLHKLYRQVGRHSAQRRNVRRESAAEAGAPVFAAAHEPSPEAAVILADELAAIMQELSDDVGGALELRLQGHELEEIAQSLGKSERTIRRWLDEARAVLRKHFPEAIAAMSVPRRVRPARKHLPLETFSAGPPLKFDDYTLQRQIGSGSSGKVFRAVVRPEHRVVAVKFLRRQLLRRPEVIERFLSEARIVAGLDHPGIIRIHGVGRTPNGGYFLAMDFHERGDLQRGAGVLPAVEESLRYVAEAAIAVQHAHERGVLHLDLKPDNLLLADDGRVVVTDFGLARQAADLSTAALAGTPAFLAPEQLDPRWGPIGRQTDVYGLGAVLYTLLIGHPPRTGTLQEVLEAASTGRTKSPLDNVLPEIAAMCARCLASYPADRPSSADQIAKALLSR